ncbi:MAG TPA: hypothetical protein VME47_03905 [Acetobacteraceae bacterium]|nr:hypothetical protein [Acetobacteraceae bacterium]
MKLPDVRHWLGLDLIQRAGSPARAPPVAPAPAIVRPPPLVVPAATDADEDNRLWSPARLEVVEALWGDGFQFPGGEGETLRLVKPLGLSAASSLLLVGAGSGGPPCSVASDLGAWVTGYESDRDLLRAAMERAQRSKVAKRARVASWDPESPHFERGYYHHGLALEPLRDGALEPTLVALAQGLKPLGHLVLLETVADKPLDPGDPEVAAWQRLDRRRLDRLPTEVSITRALGRLGFDVRIVEDVSRRHIRQAVEGWRQAVRGMEQVKPTHGEAAQLVKEAELWLLRIRLLRNRSLRLLRWHAIGTA